MFDNPTVILLAQNTFERWRITMGLRDGLGNTIQTWAKLSDHEQTAWKVAVMPFAMADVHLRNLGQDGPWWVKDVRDCLGQGVSPEGRPVPRPPLTQADLNVRGLQEPA